VTVPSLLRTSIVGALTALVLVAGAPAAAIGSTTDHFASNAAQEAILSEMAIHPASIHRDGITYVAYQGPGYDPYLCAYDESTRQWSAPIRIGTNPLSLDAHGAPSMFFDADGRLHVVFGSHVGPMLHTKMVEPGNIYEWVEQEVIDSKGTYPQAVETTAGIGMFYRTYPYDWQLRQSEETTDGLIFGDPLKVLESGSTTGYYADFRSGPDGTVYAVWTRLDRNLAASGEIQARMNAYYMQRDLDGVWRNSASQEVTLPVTQEKAEQQCKIFSSGMGMGSATNEITVKVDSAGRPCVLFLSGQGSGDGAFTWRFMRHDGTQFQQPPTPIATTDHYFDSGALFPRDDGTLEAYLVTDESDPQGVPAGRGGGIGRWVSADNGETWDLVEERISPTDPLSRFADPQTVKNGTKDSRVVFIEWTDDPTSFFQRVYLWGENGFASRTGLANPWRLEGENRVKTAVAVSQHSYPERARTVVLATAYSFPDALAGTPLAHAVRGPLLLTQTNQLDPAVTEEIVRLGATRVILLGGVGALSADIEAQLREQTTVTRIDRLGGSDRYATALAIAQQLKLFSSYRGEAVVVNGRDWPDAVSAAPLAATLGAPIVLADGKALRAPMQSLLTEWGVTTTLIVGGTGAVSPEIEAALPWPTRIGGANRYETSKLFADYSLTRGMLPHRVLFATGTAFPDALCSSALAARVRGPVLLTGATSLPSPARTYLSENGSVVGDAYFIGGEGVIGPEIPRAVRPYTD